MSGICYNNIMQEIREWYLVVDEKHKMKKTGNKVHVHLNIVLKWHDDVAI